MTTWQYRPKPELKRFVIKAKKKRSRKERRKYVRKDRGSD